MDKTGLDQVFGGGLGEEGAEMDMEEEDPEAEEAVDLAIDEAFEATDPVARREAFKNAVRLCKEEHY